MVVCGWPALASPHSRVSHNWRRPPWPWARPPTWRRGRHKGGQAAPPPAGGRRGVLAADVWALGATMFFAVEGAPPFDKGTLVRTLAAVVDEDPRPML